MMRLRQERFKGPAFSVGGLIPFVATAAPGGWGEARRPIPAPLARSNADAELDVVRLLLRQT